MQPLKVVNFDFLKEIYSISVLDIQIKNLKCSFFGIVENFTFTTRLHYLTSLKIKHDINEKEFIDLDRYLY